MLYVPKVVQGGFVPNTDYPIIITSDEGEHFEMTKEAFERLFSRAGLPTDDSYAFTLWDNHLMVVPDESFDIDAVWQERGDIWVLGAGKFHYAFSPYNLADGKGYIYLIVPDEEEGILNWNELYSVIDERGDGVNLFDGETQMDANTPPEVFEGVDKFKLYIYPVE